MKEFKGTKAPWNISKKGDITSEHHPVCSITKGEWGDDYCTLALRGTSLQRECVPVMERIVYGEIPKKESDANAQLIASSPELLEALQAMIKLWDDTLVAFPVLSSETAYIEAKKVVNKALGE